MTIPTRPSGRLAYLTVLCALASLAPGCDESSSTQPAPSASPSPEERLLFSSGRTGHAQLYTIAANGASDTLVRLLVSDGDDLEPVWSPDGARVAFTAVRGQARSIYWIEATGEQVTPHPVTPPSSEQSGPAWAPDGQRILYTSYLYENADLSRVAIDGDPNSLIDLTDVKYPEEENDQDHDGGNWDGCWSPDGLRMAFTSNRDDNWNIYTASAEARTNPRDHVQITDHPAGDWDPAYSPDGEWLAFVSDRDGNPNIFIVSAHGEPGTLRRLTTSPHVDADPAWSPDGEWIAYTSYPDDRGAIYVIAASGDPSTRQRIVTDPMGCWGPQWRPRP